jgi:diguanylate cyclase (GGDEF)-like protein/PAS domain S-box-containing protein
MTNQADRHANLLHTEPASPRPPLNVGILGIGLLLVLSSAYSYLLFHTLVELFTLGVALAILLLAWNTREVQDIDFFKIIAIGFGAAASIDLVNILTYKGMNLFPGYGDTNLSTQLWIVARYLQALSLLAASLVVHLRLHPRGLATGYGVLTLLLVMAIVTGHFPDGYVEGQGLTSFKLTSEYLIVAMILAAVVLFHQVRATLDPTTYRLLQVVALLTMAQEIVFTAYPSAYDLGNIAGHFLRVAAYYLLYRALFVTALRDPFAILFRDINASHLALIASQEEIHRLNAGLERRVAEQTVELAAEIGARRRAERALTESAANFQAFFETIGDLILVAAPDGRILFANQACQRLLGYTDSELAGMQVVDLHPAACRQEAGEIFAAMFRGERQTCPLPLATKAGIWVPVETRIWAGHWNGADCIFGLSKDLSAEQEAQQRFERLFHHNPTMMALTTLPERRFADVNQAFLDALDYTRAEVIGNTAADLGLFHDPVHQQAVMDQLQAQGRCRDLEIQVRRKDGALLDGLFSGEVIHSQGRQYYLTVMINITRRKQAEQRLHDSEQRFRELFAYLPVAYQSLDSEGRWLDANQALADLLGYDQPEALLGRRFAEVWDSTAQQDFGAIFAAFKARVTSCVELRLRRRDERPVTVIMTGRWECDPATGAFVRSYCVLTDISERQATEQVIRDLNAQLERKVEERTRALQAVNAALRESEEGFRTLFEDTRQPLALIEGDRFVAANRATLQMLRAEYPGQVVGHTSSDFAPRYLADGSNAAERAAEYIRMARAHGAHEFEWESLRVDGEPFPSRLLLTAIRRGSRHQIHVVWNDITEQKQAQARIEFLAFHDELTGLPNRVMGQCRLQQALASASRHQNILAGLYLDLDRFKYVNDTHGHLAGDQLLKALARRMEQQLRAEDSFCRLAADEFMLVLPALSAGQPVASVAQLCERLLASLALPFEIEGHEIFASISIGVAVYPEDGTDGETLMRHADIALFEAKRAGRQTYRCFETRMNDELTRFIHTRDALRQALERQEFSLHYQPQFDLRTGRVVGLEALIRWQGPEGELIMPEAFIDVAEESGLIVPIGRWVLGEACRQAATWQAAGWPDLVMAVNLSAVQFRHGQVGAEVLAALAASGLAPQGLELELTESILLHDEDAVLKIVADWKAKGIHLAIDDFGIGYSSLAYLKRFQVDKIKIDRSFVVNLMANESDHAIVVAMIQIARSLKLRTIAEGVEDRALAVHLSGMGCDEVQGYYFARPMPAGEVVPWLVKAHATPQPLGDSLGDGVLADSKP